MKKVFKYTLGMSDVSIVQLPVGAQILKIEEQNDSASEGILYIWAMVDPDEKFSEPRKFRIAGTGHDVTLGIFDENKMVFYDTILTRRDSLIWHIFEIKI